MSDIYRDSGEGSAPSSPEITQPKRLDFSMFSRGRPALTPRKFVATPVKRHVSTASMNEKQSPIKYAGAAKKGDSLNMKKVAENSEEQDIVLNL